MGHNEADAPKVEQTSSTQTREPPTVLPYPDWAAMQAYYGPGVIPSPYFAPTIASGHAVHPYIWAPQPVMAPPFGSQYTAIYPPAGLYPHLTMPNGLHAQYQGMALSSEAVVMATPLSMEMPAKSTGNKDKNLVKKFKRVDWSAVDNGNTADTVGANWNGLSQSGYNSAEGSSGGSDGNNTSKGSRSDRKRSSEDLLRSGKPSGHAPASVVDMKGATNNRITTTAVPAAGAIMSTHGGVPSELWIQDDRGLKRERRKQSNRESARRSRLRKQAETEELAMRVEKLSSENTNIRAKISRLTEKSDNLRSENFALVEKLKKTQPNRIEKISLGKLEAADRTTSIVLENFLSMIDNQSSVSRAREQEREGAPAATDRSSGKLRQLLDTNLPRTDAVAAS